MAAKRINKILGRLPEMLLYNSELYMLFINIQISFFPKEDIYPGGLLSEGTNDRRDLYLSNLLGLYIRVA